MSLSKLVRYAFALIHVLREVRDYALLEGAYTMPDDTLDLTVDEAENLRSQHKAKIGTVITDALDMVIRDWSLTH